MLKQLHTILDNIFEGKKLELNVSVFCMYRTYKVS